MLNFLHMKLISDCLQFKMHTSDIFIINISNFHKNTDKINIKKY